MRDSNDNHAECEVTTFWGDPYGIPPGPWETFGGPKPTPPMEWRPTLAAPSHWPRGWTPVADARSLHNLLELVERGNFYGIELRALEGAAQLRLEVAA